MLSGCLSVKVGGRLYLTAAYNTSLTQCFPKNLTKHFYPNNSPPIILPNVHKTPHYSVDYSGIVLYLCGFLIYRKKTVRGNWLKSGDTVYKLGGDSLLKGNSCKSALDARKSDTGRDFCQNLLLGHACTQ